MAHQIYCLVSVVNVVELNIFVELPLQPIIVAQVKDVTHFIDTLIDCYFHRKNVRQCHLSSHLHIHLLQQFSFFT